MDQWLDCGQSDCIHVCLIAEQPRSRKAEQLFHAKVRGRTAAEEGGRTAVSSTGHRTVSKGCLSAFSSFLVRANLRETAVWLVSGLIGSTQHSTNSRNKLFNVWSGSEHSPECTFELCIIVLRDAVSQRKREAISSLPIIPEFGSPWQIC